MQALGSAPNRCCINNTRKFSPTPKSLHLSNSHLPNLIVNPKPISQIPSPLTRPLLCANSSNAITSPDGDNTKKNNLGDWIQSIGEAISVMFLLWVALGCLIGLLKPSSYNWVKPQWTVMGMTLTMLGMGMTHTFDDLRGALAMPKELFCGFVLQYSV
ncbi:putative salt tolerance-like protein-like [Capsicum annuum]|nr:putative salt tolerance-like protein-like [Capsicum annuum]